MDRRLCLVEISNRMDGLEGRRRRKNWSLKRASMDASVKELNGKWEDGHWKRFPLSVGVKRATLTEQKRNILKRKRLKPTLEGNSILLSFSLSPSLSSWITGTFSRSGDIFVSFLLAIDSHFVFSPSHILSPPPQWMVHKRFSTSVHGNKSCPPTQVNWRDLRPFTWGKG